MAKNTLYRIWRAPVLLLLSALLTPGCQTLGIGKTEEPTVFLARHDKSRRVVILIRDLELPVRVKDLDPLPYHQEAFAGVQIGTGFPHKDAAEAIHWALFYYPQLRYVALSDYAEPETDYFENELHIGVPTADALCLGLKAWTRADFEALRAIETESAFRQFIRARYAPEDRLCAEEPD